MKTTRFFLLLLLVSGMAQAQRINKKTYYTPSSDSLLRNAVTHIAANAPDQQYDSLGYIIISNITMSNDVEGNLYNIISFATRLNQNQRFILGAKWIDKAIVATRKLGDTLNFSFSQLYNLKATLLRDQNKMEEALAPSLLEIDILDALDTNHPALLESLTNLMTNYFALRKTEKGLLLSYQIIELANQTGYRYYEINTYRLLGDIFKFYQPSLGLECMQYANWLANRYQREYFARDPFYCISMGSAFIANNQPDSAVRWFRYGLNLVNHMENPSETARKYLYYYLGVSYKNMLLPEDAVAFIDTSLRLDRRMKIRNQQAYARAIHMKGKLLNQLEKYDSALIINRKALLMTGKENASFYANAVEQLGRSLLGSGKLEEALVLVQSQICRMTFCNDTTNLLAQPELNHRVTPQTELRDLSFILGLKNEILAACFLKTNNFIYTEAIISNMRYLLTVIDLEAGMSQSPEGLADLSHRYRLFADQLVDFFAEQNPVSHSVFEEIYPLIARSQAYSVICRSYSLGGTNDSIVDKQTYRLNQINEALLTLHPGTDTLQFENLKQEELGMRISRYMEALDTGKSTGQILVPQMLPSKQINLSEGLNADEALIDFYSTKKHIARFIITHTSFEPLIQPLPDDFGQICENLTRAIKTGDDQQTRRASGYLSSLLFNNIKEQDAIHRLTIIPDEKLYYIPFELLRFPGSKRMLIEDYTIGYRYTSHLYKPIENTRLIGPLVAFAPMTQAGITPLVSTQVRSNEVENSGVREIIDPVSNAFAPLPYSFEEVNDVVNLFSERGIKTSLFTGAEANKANLKQTVRLATILHIATHGLVNKDEPDKSGLVLAADTTQKSDAMLYLGEMFGLKLNPSLVVLSACKSGTGILERGEGVMALPRGLLVAGAQNVMASLWNVNDLSTRPLMVSFYRHLLSGDDYPTALRDAKMECIKKGFLPIDWAGFVLIER